MTLWEHFGAAYKVFPFLDFSYKMVIFKWVGTALSIIKLEKFDFLLYRTEERPVELHDQSIVKF